MTLEILELKDLAENIDNKIKEDTKMRRTLKQDISKHFQQILETTVLKLLYPKFSLDEYFIADVRRRSHTYIATGTTNNRNVIAINFQEEYVEKERISYVNPMVAYEIVKIPLVKETATIYFFPFVFQNMLVL